MTQKTGEFDSAQYDRDRDDFEKLRASVDSTSDYWPQGSWPHYVLALLRRIEKLEAGAAPTESQE